MGISDIVSLERKKIISLIKQTCNKLPLKSDKEAKSYGIKIERTLFESERYGFLIKVYNFMNEDEKKEYSIAKLGKLLQVKKL